MQEKEAVMKRSPHDKQDPVTRLSGIDLRTLPPDGGEGYNRLIFEKSPYLLQHAENPIDWYPWGEEAFARARAEDKPVFLSIGYSTCHWCHAMAHESFEDEEVARVINRHFIAIKVDREERPDLDSTYMAVCQMMTGSGGWPLNLILTPEKKPFFAATYIPRTARMGMAGLTDLLEKVAELWLTDRARLLQTGEEVRQALLRLDQGTTARRPLSDAPLHQAFEQYVQSFDRQDAGFGRAPKFPTPHNLSLLLRLWRRTGEEKARIMALQTLQRLRLGGIFDQVGFGLHRYSVDARWLVPHFEKMLYDNALLIPVYLELFQCTRDLSCFTVIKQTLEYVVREMTSPQGGFYSTQDADSEGEEGKFFVWSEEEIVALLGPEDARIFCYCYDVTGGGNWEGHNILNRPKTDAQAAAVFDGLRRLQEHQAALRMQRVDAPAEARGVVGRDDRHQGRLSSLVLDDPLQRHRCLGWRGSWSWSICGGLVRLWTRNPDGKRSEGHFR